MYREHTVAVVMPVHNEQSLVEQAIRRVPDYVDTIIVIDDGSTDKTGEALGRISDARLIKLRHDRNRGVGAATKTGYLYCLKAPVDLIAVMDGDGQMDGRDLTQLLARALNGADYVKGNRFLDTDSIRCMPRLRYLGNRFFSWLARRAASFDHHLDAHCGYTVIHQKALKRLVLHQLYDRYGFPTEMFFAVRREGLAVESVPVRTVYANEVSGINPFTTVPVILFLIARNYFRRRFAAGSKAFLNPDGANPIEYHLEA